MPTTTTNPADLITPEAIAAGVEVLQKAAQKSASIGEESCDSPEMLAALNPWLFGKKNVRPLLTDAVLGLRTVSVHDYLNLLSIAFRLEPSISVCAVSYGDIPEPAEVMAALAAR